MPATTPPTAPTTTATTRTNGDPPPAVTAAEIANLLTRLDGHLIVHPEHAETLLELLDLLDEVLRYGGDDLRADIAERFHPGMPAHLIEALDTHAGLLRRATTTLHKGPKPR